jgi:uncharacterized protein (DUF302 family)
MENAVLTLETKKDPTTAGAALRDAIMSRGFGVVAVHDLRETMAKKGVDLGRACDIYEVCNPHQAKQVLDSDMSISSALPCRISVYEEDGKTRLSTILPSLLLSVFGREDLATVAEEVSVVIQDSLHEVVNG